MHYKLSMQISKFTSNDFILSNNLKVAKHMAILNQFRIQSGTLQDRKTVVYKDIFGTKHFQKYLLK